MFENLGFLLHRAALGTADAAVTLPLVRWTWSGLSETGFEGRLTEFRPTDRETVGEMMAGRYLLASKLVDTGGTSPFAINVEHGEWLAALHSFSWLRHFRDARDEGERGFARTLAMEWISREGRFRRNSWAPALCAQRVMNWLRHLPLLVEGTSPDQSSAVARSLRTQLQALKLRGPLASRPADKLLGRDRPCRCGPVRGGGQGRARGANAPACGARSPPRSMRTACIAPAARRSSSTSWWSW